MLTQKQRELLLFIHNRIELDGVSPSFDEMKDALHLASKSGIHRLITALEERGFLRRLPHRARALEVLKLPPNPQHDAHQAASKPRISRAGSGVEETQSPFEISVLGQIAAGTPISAIQHEIDRIPLPASMIGAGEHFALQVKGDSMIEAGILDGDTVIIQRRETADTGDIVVALVDDEEATLKTLRKKGAVIALVPANQDYETRELPATRVKVQGRLVGLLRQYN